MESVSGQSVRPSQVVGLVGTVTWLGGLLRVFADIWIVIQTDLFPQGLSAHDIFVGVLTVLILAVTIAFLMPLWVRFYREYRSDIAALFGNAVPRSPDIPALPWSRSLRALGIIAVFGCAAVLVASLLPGLLAASVALLVGLTLRVVSAVLASRDIQRR